MMNPLNSYRFTIHAHEIIESLMAALDAKDWYTAGHSDRVAELSSDLAKSMGLHGRRHHLVHMAAHLHDIGKIGVPENVLNKRGKLLPHEWAQMRRHPEIGAGILSRSKRLHELSEIVLHHHERWDGDGYPSGLKLDRIPLGARIIAVADAIDAMTSARPYRNPMDWEACRLEIIACKGTQFDPVVVEAAQGLWHKWERRYARTIGVTRLQYGAVFR